jgi:hypothetical protein
LDNWKRNLAKEACPTIDLNLIQNQSTCFEKVKQKNNNKIIQHENTNPSSILPLLPPCPTPFSFKQLHMPSPLPSILMTGGGACGQPSPPPSSPRQQQRRRQALMIPQTFWWWLHANHPHQLALLDDFEVKVRLG